MRWVNRAGRSSSRHPSQSHRTMEESSLNTAVPLGPKAEHRQPRSLLIWPQSRQLATPVSATWNGRTAHTLIGAAGVTRKKGISQSVRGGERIHLQTYLEQLKTLSTHLVVFFFLAPVTLFYRKRWVRITCKLVIKDQGSGPPLFW